MRLNAQLTCLFGALMVSASPALGDGGGGEAAWLQERFELIAAFAERICHTAPLKAKSNELVLSAKANAELKGLLKKLADLGVGGAAEYKSAESEGVLQKDLAALLSKEADCKQNISNKLIERLFK